MTKLLAVDDSNTMRKVLEITFEGTAIDATIVGTAQDALGAVDQVQPSIALVDVTLPDVNGYDLCQQLKSRANGLKVVILSSKQQPYDKARGSSAGADDFMDKPFDTQQLLTKLESVSAAAPVAAAAPAARPAAAPAVARPAPAAARPAPAAARPAPAVSAPPKPQAAPAAARPAPQQAAVMQRPAAAQPAAQRPVAAAPRTASVAAKPAAAAPAATPKPAAAVAKTAAVAAGGALKDQLAGLGLTQAQVDGVLALSQDVIEKVVWEVVPVLAETLIKEEIERLTKE